MNRAVLAGVLRAARARRGFSAAQVARLANVHVNTVRKLETGKSAGRADVVLRIAAVLRVNLQEEGRSGGKA